MNRNTRVMVIALSALLLALTAFGLVWAKKDKPAQPWIGVYTESINSDLKTAYKLDRADGIVVIDVVEDSPAEEAGLRRKDVIVKFNGKTVDGTQPLADLVDEAKVGDTVTVVYLRKGQEKSAVIEIGTRPGAEESVFALTARTMAEPLRQYYKALSLDHASGVYMGVSIQDLNDQLGDYFGVKKGNGVLITEVLEDSPAQKAGLKAGDVIISADGETVTASEDLTEIIDEKDAGDTVTIGYLRRGSQASVAVEVTEDELETEFTIPTDGHVIIKSRPGARNLDYFYRDDGTFDLLENEGYKESLQELKKEVEQMKKELEEVKSKLD
jgi:serine protease Do